MLMSRLVGCGWIGAYVMRSLEELLFIDVLGKTIGFHVLLGL